MPLPVESKYRIITELGRGGMATAYLAALSGPAEFRKLAVLKQLHPQLAAEPELLQMFLDEARLAARIDHPNVVHTYEVTVDGPRSFIAMEYIEGQSLETIFRKGRATAETPDVARPVFPLGLHLRVLCDVLEGLHFAHELRDFGGAPLGIVHRDMSPHNVMVSYQGHAKLVDFGVAKAKTSVGHTTVGTAKGKSAYMPAEQFEGIAVDRRADVFAVGVMLWQALTKQRLFVGRSDADIYRALLEGVPSPRSVESSVPEDLDAICCKALATRRESRYSTAAEFLTALEASIRAHSDLHASARDVAAWLDREFADERAAVLRDVESALNALARPAVPTPGPSSGRALRSRGAIHLPIYAAGMLVAVLAFTGLRAARLPRALASAATDDTTRIEVRAPASARVRLDGAALDGSPARAELRRDGTRHLMRVESDGYEPYVAWIGLSAAHVVFDVSLTATPVVRPPSVRPPSSETAAPDAGSSAQPERTKSLAPAHVAPLKPSQLAAAPPVVASVATAASAVPSPSARPTGLSVEIDKDNPFRKAP